MFVFIENLAYYNEGKIVGDWFHLGADDKDLEQFLKDVVKVDKEHEEYFIADFESDYINFIYNPYCDIFELNRLVAVFNELSETEKDTVRALREAGICNTLSDALDYASSYEVITDVKTEYDVGYYFLSECNLYDIPEFIRGYIDYERYGRDIILSGDGELTDCGYLMAI